MAKSPRRPPVAIPPPADPTGFWSLFEAESDRAAAVLGGSYLEAVFERVLRSWMPPGASPEAVDSLFEPGRGFLGSFGAKKNLAFILGILSQVEKDDAQRIASVRNFFAHHVLDADGFEHPYASGVIQSITFYPYPKWFLEHRPTRANRRTVRWLKQASLRDFYLWAIDHICTGVLTNIVPPTTPRAFAVSMQVAQLCRVSEKLGHEAWGLPSTKKAHTDLARFWRKEGIFK